MIRQYPGVILAALIAAVLQSTVLSFMTESLNVDLLFAIVVVIGLSKDPVHGSIMCAALGYLGDLMAADLTGLFMTARLSVFMAAQALRGRLSPDTPLSQLSIGLGLGVFDNLSVQILHQVFAHPMPLSARGLLLLLLGIFINAALVPLFYLLFSWLPGFIEKPRGPAITE